MTTKDNILAFPKHKIVREFVPETEQLMEMKERGLQNFALGLATDLSENVLRDLDGYGIDITNDQFIKDYSFLMCVLNATLHRSLNIEHPFHAFLDENAKFLENLKNEITTNPTDEETPTE